MADDKLGEYAAKRRFTLTPEPAGAAVERRAGPLLFVIQRHSARRLHYDLRLECDGVLKSWAIPKGPSLDPAEKRLAMQTEDHPFQYASFEGVIPEGQYGAGEMIVWDCGVFSPDEGGPCVFHDRAEAECRVREGLAKGKLSFLLRGHKTKGSFALVRTREARNWLLIKHKDRFAGKIGLLEEESVLGPDKVPAERLAPSGDTSAIPATLAPMHAELTEAAFNDAAWMWEPKLDGYRALAFITDGGVSLRSRRGLDLASDFPRLTAELGAQAVDSMILDGELVAFDASGKPSFAAMQNRGSAIERTIFYCFDLLYFAGIDLRRATYGDRRRYLAQCLLPGPLVQLVHATQDGVALQEAASRSGLEGVVGKRKQSRYESGRRSSSWVKVKAVKSGDFVIAGYTKGKGARAPLGALLLGYWKGKALQYASHVGSGFDERSILQLKQALLPLARKTCPFAKKPELNGPTSWVEPEIVAEVKFQDWTEDGRLRAPVFLRLRDDLDPR